MEGVTHILYILRNERNSALALQHASDAVAVEAVDQMDPREVPRFVVGVPTLLDIDQRALLYGNEAIQALQLLSNVASAASPSAPRPPNSPSLPRPPQQVGLFDPMPVAAADDRYDSGRKVSMADVERMQRMRAQTQPPEPMQ